MTGQFLDLFAPDEDVAALVATLAGLERHQRLNALVPLAWHLRERDCTQALALADEAELLLLAADIAETERTRSMARLLLVRASVQVLFTDLDDANKLTESALAMFERLGDRIGAGDACWLLASIWHDRGDRQQVDASLNMALNHYQATGDTQRIEASIARNLALSAFSDVMQSAAGLKKHFPETGSRHDSVNTWLSIAHANVAALTDDPGEAIKNDLQAHQTARKTGQIRQALVCAVNVSEGFATLGDLDVSLEWIERTLTLARDNRWPGSIGVCLVQIGDVLRLLARHDEAQDYFREALVVMHALAGSRNCDQVLGHLGELALDVGNHEEALDWFLELEHAPSSRGDPYLLTKAWRGQATTLARLGRPGEASLKATAALELARANGNSEEQIKALRVLAELHAEQTLAPPVGMTAPSAALHYLNRARKIAESISGYAVPADLLHQIATAHAAANDYRSAYECSLAATAARNNMRLKEAQKRALAMKIRHEIERARADSEQHKTLAAALQETNTTLETLGLIGREITASLDANEVFEALHRHVDRLLDAASFVIYLLDPKGETLNMAFGVEEGVPHPPISIAIDNPIAYSSRCLRERREIVVNQLPTAQDVKMVPGTIMTMSMLFSPLEVGKRLLGVMTIQSIRPEAYGERECSIFRTLCAYGAIALDNSAAYSAVDTARRQAARHEQELRIAATAFESQEGMFITDANRVILRVNSAFTKITGYVAEEVVGKRPNMFRSSMHGPDFYVAMSMTLESTGRWQGEIWTRRKNGESFPLWLSITAVRSDEGLATHLVFALADITDRKLAEDEIHNLAFYDPLTNLPNRRLLMDRLRHALATSERDGNEGALLFVDLDNFKKLNDTRGHDVGDLLLVQVGQRLGTCLRDGDTTARLGGDEFVVLLEGLGDDALQAAEKADLVAEKILTTLNQVYLLQGKEYHSTPSIGVCLFKGQGVPVDDLLKQADLAMYQSKAAGRNAIRFFDPAMQAAVSAHAALEIDLRKALASQQFVLHYQTQVDATGRVIGAEALVRWQHPDWGMVMPGAFIPLAEETGLILPLGEWVLKTACQQLQHWAADPDTAHLTLAVNISARQFHDPHFVEQVLAVLAGSDANPGKLKLELTESLLVKDVEGIIFKMRTLMRTGLRFSLDDFGTGYSSLSYLKQLPLEQLKIDQSFVRDIFVNANDLAIVRAIVTLGRSLGLSVIAEGVETEEQRQFLEESGCQIFQGYLFGKPMPADALSLSTRHPDPSTLHVT